MSSVHIQQSNLISLFIEYIRQLSSELRSWKSKAEETHQQIDREQTAEEQLSESIIQIKQIEAELPKKLSQLQEEQRRLEIALHEKEGYISTMRTEYRSLLNKEGQIGALTAKYFGMELNPRNDRGVLGIVLTQIDRRNPQRPFSFSLRIVQIPDAANQGTTQPRGRYVIDECEPQIPFQPLLDELNRTNALQRFVVQMRHMFDQHANHGLSPCNNIILNS